MIEQSLMPDFSQYFCLADAEREWQCPSPSLDAAFARPLNQSLQWLPLLFAAPDSTLCVNAPPEDPEWNCPPHLSWALLSDSHQIKKNPQETWIWAQSSIASQRFGFPDQAETMAYIASKKTLADWGAGPQQTRWVCSWEEIHQWRHDTGVEKAVLKLPLGSSGRGHYLLPLHSPPGEEAKHRVQVSRMLNLQNGLLIQPWLTRVCDFSSQWWVEDSPRFLGATLMVNSPAGKYCGSFSGPPGWIQTRLQDFWSQHEQAAADLLRRLRQEGYQGPCGIDAMIVRDQDSLVCVPVVEINPRHTMGWVALEQQRQQGGWIQLSWGRSTTPGPLPRKRSSKAPGGWEQFQPIVKRSTAPPTAVCVMMQQSAL